MAQYGAEWPEFLEPIKMVVLDFDKTITKRHTRGAIFQTAALADEELLKNLADVEFFRKIVPIICKNAKLCIATFADHEEESLLSGVALVRKYLDIALAGDSSRFIPDVQIEAWNPENRDMDMKVVGKDLHLDALRKRIDPKLKKSQIVLFDDSDRNIVLASKKGYATQFVVAAKDGDDGSEPTGFCLDAWQKFLTKQANRKEGGCVIA
eukprot:m.8691 g.8691  ORF g.8691 m.8691 type:complete len:209 (+) comp2889_c0_seq1:370-996(+)